jgi:hypothetical protein
VDFYLKTVGGSEPELEVSDDDDDDDDIIALPLGNLYPVASVVDPLLTGLRIRNSELRLQI